MVDSSDVVNWSQMLRFVTTMLGSFVISQDKAHVGFIVFGDTANVSFGFSALQGESYSREGVEQAIQKITQLGGNQRRIDLAFDVAYKDLFSDAGGARATARKVKAAMLSPEGLKTSVFAHQFLSMANMAAARIKPITGYLCYFSV